MGLIDTVKRNKRLAETNSALIHQVNKLSAENQADVATNTADIITLNSVINQIFMSGITGFAPANWFGAVQAVAFSDVDAAVLSTLISLININGGINSPIIKL